MKLHYITWCIAQDEQNQKDRNKAKLRTKVSDEDCWIWSDVDDNDLDSMSNEMNVLITAKQLRKLLEK